MGYNLCELTSAKRKEQTAAFLVGVVLLVTFYQGETRWSIKIGWAFAEMYGKTK